MPAAVDADREVGCVLTEDRWRALEQVHRDRVSPWITPHLGRRAGGVRHPVEDFLFEYYSFSPGKLLSWHPGIGVQLVGAAVCPWASERHYRIDSEPGGWRASADPSGVKPERLASFAWMRRLLASTLERPAHFGCHGLHEWAMVYRLAPEEVRHADWPLRLPPRAVAELVESHGLACSHFDAFRFFTPEAVPLNRRQLSRGDSIDQEQAGCLHANMDLYKWAFKLAPFSPSELIADCFELAKDIRLLDMQASPYDFSGLGLPPVAIETVEGRQEYERRQRSFSQRARPLRLRLIAVLDRVAVVERQESASR